MARPMPFPLSGSEDHGRNKITLEIAILGIADFLEPHHELGNLVHPFWSPTARNRPPEAIQIVREPMALKCINGERYEWHRVWPLDPPCRSVRRNERRQN